MGIDVLLSGKYSDIIFIVDIKFILSVLYEKSFVVLNNIYIIGKKILCYHVNDGRKECWDKK